MKKARTPLLLVCLLIFLQLHSSSIHVFASDDTRQYEWDDWDYYEILGLDRNAEYSEKEIKKAYRKQAQQWHPDKVGDNTTKQESNNRFARIAEAYQVLSNEKQDYDTYLRRREQPKSDDFSREASSSDGRGYYDDPREFYVDPWAIFQEFFGSHYHTGYFDNVYGDPSYTSSSQRIGTRTPDRVFVEEEFFVNDYGQTIVRKIQTSSYFFSGQGFLQSIAQDYAPRQQDLYTGEWFYHPLQVEPVVWQEGIFELENEPKFIPRFMDSSSLWPEVSLVQGSKMHKGSYVMELSSDCDLICYREGINDDEQQHLIWSLRERGEMPFYVNAASDCRLELQADQLFLYIANNADSVLWTSEPDDERDQRSNSYVARLDTDGALAVYRIQAAVIQHSWLSRIWTETMLATEPNSLSSIVYELFWSLILGRRIRRISSEGVTSETCIAAVGSPIGCFRVGRKLVQLWRNAKAYLERVLSFVDHLLDKN